MNKKIRSNNSLQQIGRLSTRILIAIPMALSLLTLAVYILLNPSGFSDESPTNFLIFLAFFFIGMMGIPILIRKEFPFLNKNFEGPLAILQGLIFLILGLLAAATPFIGYIARILHH